MKDSTQRSWLMLCICRSFVVRRGGAFRSVPIPRLAVGADETVREFDELVDHGVPVILERATLCPRTKSLSNLMEMCDLQSEVHLRRARVSQGGWAGLEDAGVSSLQDFFSRMIQDENMQENYFAFGLPIIKHCPLMLQDGMQVPGVVKGHLMLNYSGTMDDCSLQRIGLYMTSGEFQTDLHIDAYHAAFVASVCEGAKHWRVMRNVDFRETLAGSRAVVTTSGAAVFGRLGHEFETWSNSSPLDLLDVELYEGLLSPGDLLYVPEGAPHAAHSPDTSVMIAFNDWTFRGIEEVLDVCAIKRLRCDNAFTEMRSRMQEGKRRSGNVVGRRDSSLLEAAGCTSEKLCKSLRVGNNTFSELICSGSESTVGQNEL